MSMAERELSAFLSVVTELYGAEQARISAEDWIDEFESASLSTLVKTLIEKRGHLSDQELDSFIAAGFTKEQIPGGHRHSRSLDDHKLRWNHRQSTTERSVPAVRVARVKAVTKPPVNPPLVRLRPIQF
jgi:hypothetical protein